MSAGAPECVPVRAGESTYEVVVGAGVMDSLGERTVHALGAAPGRAMLVMDAGVGEPLRAAARRSLEAAGFDASSIEISPSEAGKSLEGLETILRALAASRHERRDPVVALGGGVVGDMAGLAAAVYRRGCPIIQAPTTLLAMVDASVGGKTAVNLRTDAGLRKNLVGAFWQPAMVLADVRALETLSARLLSAGLAECVKHGMIGATDSIGSPDPNLLAWIEANVAAIRAGDAALARELVVRNVSVKAAVVAGDEREEAPSGGRALLNLGHTFGHAIEPIPTLAPEGQTAPLLHGEAVALGLVAACFAGEALGLCDEGLRLRTCALLKAAGLPTRIAGLPPMEQLEAAMRDDKKVAGGRLRLIVPDGPGSARVVAAPEPSAIEAGIRGISA